MVLLGKIRRMFLRDKLSFSEISRRTGLSRNTIKKWLKQEGGAEPRYRRVRQERKLDPYQGWLDQALLADARRSRRDRRTALKLWHELCAQGFTGSYTRVLAAVPRHGLEAVVVAAELVLEQGALSAEHIENVLSRLNHPVGHNVTLHNGPVLGHAPLADMDRYDCLRVQEAHHA